MQFVNNVEWMRKLEIHDCESHSINSFKFPTIFVSYRFIRFYNSLEGFYNTTFIANALTCDKSDCAVVCDPFFNVSQHPLQKWVDFITCHQRFAYVDSVRRIYCIVYSQPSRLLDYSSRVQQWFYMYLLSKSIVKYQAEVFCNIEKSHKSIIQNREKRFELSNVRICINNNRMQYRIMMITYLF